MTRDLRMLAKQIVIDFLQPNPEPGALFWSVREISRRYKCSEYAAYNILKILGNDGYLELAPQRRAFLKEHVNLAFLGVAPGNVQPAFIWPYWKSADKGNFVADFASEIKKIGKKIHQDFLFLENPNSWGDPSLTFQLKASSSNALIAVSPPANSLILFTKLRAENLPILVVGTVRSGYNDLGIHTLDGEVIEPTRLLMLKWKSLGVRSPLVVGYGENAFCHAQQVQGLKAAFPEVPDIEAAGFFTNVGDEYSKIRELEIKLRSKTPPDALLFTDSPILEMALEAIPSLADKIRKRACLTAVYDETDLISRLPDLPIVAVKLQTKLMAEKAMEMIQQMRNNIRVPKRVMLRRIFVEFKESS